MACVASPGCRSGQIDIAVIELGANDGLRGLPVTAMKNNLQSIIDQLKAKNPAVKIVIAGMQMPPNLGDGLSHAISTAAFADLAQRISAALIPFLLEGVGGHIDLNQAGSDSSHRRRAQNRGGKCLARARSVS